MDKGTPAEIVQVLGRTGVYGEIIQVLCKILDGPEQGRVKRRNVKGNVQKGDVITLLSTEREAKEIKAR
ncbi:MAG: 30S ribosomal protein S28e [Candidatus Diapherotrites archaeon CG11_big_fil_rev_8_21_14_0_20_37_9]|nr:MAG: 30S ribosomal protein S28e [Candidatus Diapherotrites archaeon CG11_big_fil_rev_8_21_14_0_20_37_9]